MPKGSDAVPTKQPGANSNKLLHRVPSLMDFIKFIKSTTKSSESKLSPGFRSAWLCLEDVATFGLNDKSKCYAACRIMLLCFRFKISNPTASILHTAPEHCKDVSFLACSICTKPSFSAFWFSLSAKASIPEITLFDILWLQSHWHSLPAQSECDTDDTSCFARTEVRRVFAAGSALVSNIVKRLRSRIRRQTTWDTSRLRKQTPSSKSISGSGWGCLNALKAMMSKTLKVIASQEQAFKFSFSWVFSKPNVVKAKLPAPATTSAVRNAMSNWSSTRFSPRQNCTSNQSVFSAYLHISWALLSRLSIYLVSEVWGLTSLSELFCLLALVCTGLFSKVRSLGNLMHFHFA